MGVDYKRVTAVCTVMVAVFLIVVDIFAAIAPEHCNTISCNVLEWSRTFPPLVFVAGFLCGHLMWPQKVMIDIHGRVICRD